MFWTIAWYRPLFLGNALALGLYPTHNLTLWLNTPYFLLKLSNRTTCGHQICCFPQKIEIFHSGQGIFYKNEFIYESGMFFPERNTFVP